VVRSDVAEVAAAGKVILISGGGSGHEPTHAGKNHTFKCLLAFISSIFFKI